MGEQKSLLELIREKESELNERLEHVTGETESITAEARRKSEKILLDAGIRGDELAAEHYRIGKAKIDRDVEDIKRSEAENAVALRESGEKNLPEAGDLITRAVVYR